MASPFMAGSLLCHFLVYFWALIAVPSVESIILVYPPSASNLSRAAFDDRNAEFGHNIPEGGIEGLLKIPNPRNACMPIDPLPSFLLDKNMFALVTESNDQQLCPYTLQAEHAEAAGYDVLIVYNHVDDTLKFMRGQGPSICSIYVTRFAGDDLRQYAYNPSRPPSMQSEVFITRNPQLPLQFYLIPFAAVVGICFLFMLVFTSVRYIRFRRSIQKSRLSPANLKKIPTIKFKKGDAYDMCAICLDEYEEGDKLRLLPCSHVYHCKCVDPWLTAGKKVCPVCKRNVEPDSEEGSSGNVGRQQNDEENEADTDNDETTPLLSNAQRHTSSGAIGV